MLRDIWLIAQKDLRTSARNPTWIMIQIMQPMLYLFLFGPLLVKLLAGRGGSEAAGWEVLTPALVVQLALFGSSFVGFALLTEWRTGVVERLRVTPVSRVALLLGKVLVNAGQALVQAVLLVVIAYLAFDVRVALPNLLLCLLIVAALSVALASCSYALALTLKSEQAFPALLNAILIPLLLLSGILIPITEQTAPDWLYTISRANPFVYVVEAERAAFRGEFADMTTGGIVLIVLVVVSALWGTRVFQKENA